MLDEKVNIDISEFLKTVNFKTNIIYFIKWGILSIIIGVVVGLAGASFGHVISFATEFWQSHNYTL